MESFNKEKFKFLTQYTNCDIINMATGHRIPAEPMSVLQCLSEDNDIRPILKTVDLFNSDDLVAYLSLFDDVDKELIAEIIEDPSNLETMIEEMKGGNFTNADEVSSLAMVSKIYNFFHDHNFIITFNGRTVEWMHELKWFTTEKELETLTFKP